MSGRLFGMKIDQSYDAAMLKGSRDMSFSLLRMEALPEASPSVRESCRRARVIMEKIAQRHDKYKETEELPGSAEWAARCCLVRLVRAVDNSLTDDADVLVRALMDARRVLSETGGCLGQ